MLSKQVTFVVSLVFGLFVIGLLAGALLPAPVAEAGLPDRATPTPRPRPSSHAQDDQPRGAWLELQVANVPAGAWAGVEWQTSAGDWQAVDGWQGALPESSRWWVAPKDFGSGPFRWVVSRGQGGPLLGASQPFRLPAAPDETLAVTVSVE